MRVVLVDDQKLVRQGFRLILAVEPDITVVGEATNGAEGVDVVKETAPDVVLMDVQMPVMDGVAATAKVLAILDTPIPPPGTRTDLPNMTHKLIQQLARLTAARAEVPVVEHQRGEAGLREALGVRRQALVAHRDVGDGGGERHRYRHR